MHKSVALIFSFVLYCWYPLFAQHAGRALFTDNWKFILDSTKGFEKVEAADAGWRTLNLPHDWSIEGAFKKEHPATAGGGALPGGIGWYRKHFVLPQEDTSKAIYIQFDGVYYNSEVWINGHYLGKRPNGYASFQYDLTPYLKFGKENVLAVKVDNSRQPNSRWYSGSGIYRNVWLIKTGKLHIDNWGTYVTTPQVSNDKATVNIVTKISNSTGTIKPVVLLTTIYNS